MRRYFVIFALLLSCSTFRRGEKINIVIPEESFKAGIELFERGKYNEAIKKFKEVLYVTGYGDLANKSQYYISLSYFKLKDYDQAIVEFRTLLENYTGLGDTLKASALLYLARAYNEKYKNLYLDISEIDMGLYYAQRLKGMGIFSDSADKVISEILYKKATKLLLEADVYRKLKVDRSWRLYLEEFLRLYPNDPRVDSVKALLNSQ